MIKNINAGFALIIFMFSTHAYGFELPNINLEFSSITDNNLNKAQDDSQTSEDNFYELRTRATYFFELNPKHALIVNATFSTDSYDEFNGLEKTSYGLGGTWQFMTRTGFSSPVYTISLALEESDFETDIRDGQMLRLGMTMATRLTDRIPITFGYDAKQYEADTDVFDTHEQRLFSNVDYEFNKNITFYLTLSYISGDIVSTATPSLTVLNWAEVIEPDNAFGGTQGNAIAYRLEAKTTVYNLGLNYAINERNSIDTSYMTINSDADGPIEYERNIFRISFMTRF